MTTRFRLALAAGLLLAAAPADIVFGDGATHVVTTPQNDFVMVQNNTTVIFNTGGNVTPPTMAGERNGVSVNDTSTVTNNAGVITVTTSSGTNPTLANGVFATQNSVFTMTGGAIHATATGTSVGISATTAGGVLVQTFTGLAHATISGGTLTAMATSTGTQRFAQAFGLFAGRVVPPIFSAAPSAARQMASRRGGRAPPSVPASAPVSGARSTSSAGTSAARG
jgi:hypothetical protein